MTMNAQTWKKIAVAAVGLTFLIGGTVLPAGGTIDGAIGGFCESTIQIEAIVDLSHTDGATEAELPEGCWVFPELVYVEGLTLEYLYMTGGGELDKHAIVSFEVDGETYFSTTHLPQGELT